MGHGVAGRTTTRSALDAETAQRVAEVMQALAAPSRVRILGRLREGPSPVGELARAVQMEQPAVSQQLRLLRQLGLVVGQRQGRHVVYALHDDHVAQLLDEAVGHIEHRILRIPDASTASSA